MKKLMIIFTCWVYSIPGNSEGLDTIATPEYYRFTLMYHNLDARLKKSEHNMKASIQMQQEGMKRIEGRLERMENKFDKYFLWGYGTLLSIFIGVLAWMLNRFKIQQIVREPPPPSSDLKLSKQKYLYSS